MLVGTVLLLALSVGLGVYVALLCLPRFSPRMQMVTRIGSQPAAGPDDSLLGGWLRRVPLTRHLTAGRFRLVQSGLAGMVLLVATLPWLLFRRPPEPLSMLLYPVLAWLLPLAWLLVQLRRRTLLIARAYPDLLAHVATQARAGAGMLQAFASAPPVLREPLRGEVADLIADLRIAPLPAALSRFADRCGHPQIRAFVRSVMHQQALGIALARVLADEERHALALARQAVRRRIQESAIIMAAVTVILLMNALAVYFTPVVFDLSRLITQDQLSRGATVVPGLK
jgi:Flp pilus assembly protein TadB